MTLPDEVCKDCFAKVLRDTANNIDAGTWPAETGPYRWETWGERDHFEWTLCVQDECHYCNLPPREE